MLIAVFASPLAAQETIFNVPSGDILDKGKVYGEFDFAYSWDASAGTYTPRVVAGIGHRIEIGMNLNGLASPGPSQTTPTPTVKCKAYDGGKNGWAFMLGDDLFIPVQNRSYDAGNYFYAELIKTLKSQTRLTFGAFDFTPNVVAIGTTPVDSLESSSQSANAVPSPPIGLLDITARRILPPVSSSNLVRRLRVTRHMKSAILAR
jgi:hypothetical protein